MYRYFIFVPRDQLFIIATELERAFASPPFNTFSGKRGSFESQRLSIASNLSSRRQSSARTLSQNQQQNMRAIKQEQHR